MHCTEQDSIQTDEITLQEIIVQSYKRKKTFRSDQTSSTVISNTDLASRHATSTKDLAQFTPNMFTPDYGSRLTSPVYIRGIGSKINSPSVGLYVDGIPYFEKSAFDFDLNEVESVEILRGPQSTLYGRNTMGGIININTRSPFTYKNTTVSSSFGNYGYIKGQFAHYGTTQNNKIGYSVSGNASHSNGYFTNQTTKQKADNINTQSIRLSSEISPVKNLSLKLTSITDHLQQGGYPYGIVDQSGKTLPVNYNDPSSYQRTMSSNGLSTTYHQKEISIISQTSLQYLSDKQNIDQDFSPNQIYYVIQRQHQSALSQEITVKTNDKKPYKLLFGAFIFHQLTNNELTTNLQAAKYSTMKNYTIPTTGASIYHQTILDNLIKNRLSLTLGARLDYESSSINYSAFSDVSGQVSPTETFSSRLSFSQFTPKIALRYALTNNKTTYVSVTKGYKTGGFNTSFVRNEDRSCEPEHSWNYEAGAKLGYLNNLLHVDFCLFYIDWENQQIYQTIPPVEGQQYTGGQMLKNAGRSESKGVELEIRIRPSKSLNINTAWGYTRAFFRRYLRNDSTDYSGRTIPFVPHHTVSAGLDYTVPFFRKSAGQITFNINYQAIGPLYWTDDNSISQPFYGLLNGNLSIVRNNITVSLYAKNLTNTQYSAYCFESLGQRYAQRGKPFTAGITVEIKMSGSR
jgi:outer membrane receptor protein involved in Fe transport